MLREETMDQMGWAQIVEQARDQIPDICPEWTDFNSNDPGMALLELLAWFQEIQLFHRSRISAAHYRKYLKLLGIKLKSRSPGEALVTVDSKEPVWIPAGTACYAGDVPFEAAGAQMAAEGIFEQFICRAGGVEERLSGDWIREGRGLSLRPFGPSPAAGAEFFIGLRCPLNTGETWRLYLECERNYPGTFNRVLEKAFDGYGFYPLAEFVLEYKSKSGWLAVSMIKDETFGLIQNGSICFSLTEPMDKSAPGLRFRLVRCEYLTAPFVSRISFAMVKVRQLQPAESLPEFTGNGFPGQRFDLKNRLIYEEGLEVRAERIRIPSENNGSKKPRMDIWKQVEDFDNSRPEDHHYRVEDGVLLFGDGIHGMPPEGRIKVSRMQQTLGAEGNVKAGAIERMEVRNTQGGQRGCRIIPACNEFDVTGGRPGETFEQAMERYLAEREYWDRAVWEGDYERLVRSTPGIYIEDCRITGISAQKNQVTIAVKPYTEDGMGSLNHACEINIYRYLEEKRLIGTRLLIVSPEYCRVTVFMEIIGMVEYPDIGNALKEMIRSWMEKKTFGEGISYAELYGLIDTYPGVRRIKSLWIDSSRGRRNDTGDLLIPDNGLLKLSGTECVVLTESERLV